MSSSASSLLKRLESFSRVSTAPFREEWVLDVLDAMLAEIPGLEREVDSFGNRIVRLRRGAPLAPDAPRATFVAHVDHPGFLFTEETGGATAVSRSAGSKFRCSAVFEGRVEDRFFENKPAVRLFRSSDDEGIAGHIVECSAFREDSDDRLVVIETAEPADGATLGMWDVKPFEVDSEGIVRARVCDDLAGVSSIVEALARLAIDPRFADSSSNGNGRKGVKQIEAADTREGLDVSAVFSRAEEAGFCGVLCLLGEPELHPLLSRKSYFVSVEISSERPGVELGTGAIIRVGDRATTFDPQFVDAAWATARLYKLRARRALMDGGTCEATPFGRAGLKTGGVCAPVRHYHNMEQATGKIVPEAVAASDLEALATLIETVARTGAVVPAEAPPSVAFAFDTFLEKGRRLLPDATAVG